MIYTVIDDYEVKTVYIAGAFDVGIEYENVVEFNDYSLLFS